MRILCNLVWLEVGIVVLLIAAAAGGQLNPQGMVIAIITVLTVFAPLAFFTLRRETAERDASSRVDHAS